MEHPNMSAEPTPCGRSRRKHFYETHNVNSEEVVHRSPSWQFFYLPATVCGDLSLLWSLLSKPALYTVR